MDRAEDPLKLLDQLGVQALQPLGAAPPPSLSYRRLDDVTVRRISAAGFRKPQGPVRNHDSLYWTSLVSGRMSADGRGQSVVLTPELSTLRRGIGLSSISVTGPADIVSMEVPLERLVERGIDAGTLLLPMDELGRHARNYLLLLLATHRTASPAVDRCLANAAVELLAGTVMAARGYQADSASVSGALRLRAEAVIREGCADPGLRPETVAQRLHVSLRTLQRSFADSGSTVSARIDHHRMLRVERLLSSGGGLSADQVAARSGFRSAYQLRRVIQQEHGVTLRDYREMLRTVDGGGPV